MYDAVLIGAESEEAAINQVKYDTEYTGKWPTMIGDLSIHYVSSMDKSTFLELSKDTFGPNYSKNYLIASFNAG